MHAQVGGGDPHRQHCKGGVRHAPPPSLARAEDSGARGDVILAVLVLEDIVVVTLNVLEKFQALRRCHRALVIVVDPTNDVTAMLPEGKDMAGGGWGGPVIFPHHPDNDDAGRLLDDMGSTNANDDDNDDTPPRPPPKTAATPRGGRGAWTTTVPDDDVTAAAASRDAVATNATNSTNAIGPRGAHDLRATAETW